MLDYQTALDQMANHQQSSLVPSYPAQPHHISPSTDPCYFYSDNTSSRQQLAINSPLAALHGMTDMKSNQAASSSTALDNYNSAAYYSMKNSMLNATPHGITDILSRPELQAQLQARLGQGMYYNSCSQAPVAPAGLSPGSKDLAAGNRSLYHWPSSSPVLQQNQAAAWHNKHGGMLSISEGKDGKKKNTRPTFSGSQIFALEKMFEQQKYLAGPERARLAYALRMSESQVKVWFQNRRTKWRKRHAAEIASTKRRSDNPSSNTQNYDQQLQNMKSNSPGSSFPSSNNSLTQAQTELQYDSNVV